MEYLDIYDENAQKTGRVILRGTPVKYGEYSMSVHLFIYNDRGEFLIQKRSKNKRSLPGIWSVTCGAVQAGETSPEAGVREAREEVGLVLEQSQLEKICRIKRRRSFIEIYFVKAQYELSQLTLQKEEVDEVRSCSGKEMLEIISSSEHANFSYINSVRQAMRDRKMDV